jgi:HK97 gp10 family phage protein
MLKIQIDGVEDFNRFLQAEAGKDKKHLSELMNKAAFAVHAEAVNSIKEHRSSGKTYKRGTVIHTASEAGSPPNADTGKLMANITIEKDAKSVTVGSRKGAPHGFWLEFGTSRVDPRPWLQPAFDKMMKTFESLVKRGR